MSRWTLCLGLADAADAQWRVGSGGGAGEAGISEDNCRFQNGGDGGPESNARWQARERICPLFCKFLATRDAGRSICITCVSIHLSRNVTAAFHCEYLKVMIVNVSVVMVAKEAKSAVQTLMSLTKSMVFSHSVFGFIAFNGPVVGDDPLP